MKLLDEGVPTPLPTSDSSAEQVRKAWRVGSVIEYCSVSKDTWFPALVHALNLDKDVLQVQFFVQECIQHKAVPRNDWRLAPIGTHGHSTPLGFKVVQSQSRPGQLSYVDLSTGLKYGLLEIAWQVHLDRLLQAPGQATICELPGRDVAKKHFVWPTGQKSGDSSQISQGISDSAQDPPNQSEFIIQSSKQKHPPW